MRSQSFLEMRRRNALAIVSIVRGNGDISRAELAREANLSPATVSSIVDELLASGILSETGSKSTATQRGRRPIGLTFNPKSRYAAGVSIDNSKLRVVLCDLDGNPVVDSSCACDLSTSAESMVSLILEALKDVAKKTGIPIRKICAVGVALPIAIIQNEQGGVLSFHRRSSGITRHELWSRLQKKLKRAIVLDSHVNMAAIAEGSSDTALRAESVLVVRLGNVVRSALLVQGNLFAGSSGLAGEIGHVPALGHRRICECGNVGCINTVATPSALVKICQERGARVKSLDEVISEAENGNRICRDALAEAAAAVGYAIALCINVLAPQQIIITGAVSDARDLFLVPMYAAVRQHALKANLHDCAIMTSELRQMSEPLGAALKALSTEPRLLLFGTQSEISIEEERYLQN